MAHKKIMTPKSVEIAETRLSGLKSIEENLDLGKGVSVATLNGKIIEYHAERNGYNQMSAELDEKRNEVKKLEKEVRDLSQRALSGIASQYGKDTDEYEKAGGKRTSKRKRPVRKPKNK